MKTLDSTFVFRGNTKRLTLKINGRVSVALLALLFISILSCSWMHRCISLPSGTIAGHWTVKGEYSIDSYKGRVGFLFKNEWTIKDSTVTILAEGIYNIHLYFSPIDTLTKKGSYMYIVKKDRELILNGFFEYSVKDTMIDISESEWLDYFVLSYWNSFSDTIWEDWVIDKKGKRMSPMTIGYNTNFNYVDDVVRFIFGVQGLGIGYQLIFKYVNKG